MIQESKTKNRRRKRLIIAALILFALYLCFGIWGVPAILKAQIEGRGSEVLGRETKLEKASFNPFTFETKLYELSIGPAEGGAQALARVGKLTANPQLFATLFGAATLKSLTVDDADLWVSKDSSGRLSFEDLLDLQAGAPVEEGAESEVPKVIVRQVELTGLTLHFSDTSLQTPYQETIVLERFSGVDIGTVEKSSVGKPGGGEAFHWNFDGSVSTGSGALIALQGGAVSINPWGLRVGIDMDGFPLASLQPYVDEVVIAQMAGELGFELEAELTLAGDTPQITADAGLELARFSLSDEKSEFLGFEGFTVQGLRADLATREASIESIALQKPIISAVLLEDGSPLLPQLKGMSTSSATGAGEAPPIPYFAVSISSLQVLEGTVHVEDRTLQEPFRTAIEGVQLALSNLSASQKEDALDASGRLEMSAKVLEGEVSLNAEMESLAGLSRADLSVRGLQVMGLQSFVAEFSNAEVLGGAVNLDLVAESSGLAMPEVTGAFELQDFKSREARSERGLVSLKQFAISDISFADEGLALGLVRVEQPNLTIWQNAQGMNLNRIIKIEQRAEQAISEVEDRTGLAVEIGKLEIAQAGLEFVDTSLVSTYQSHLSNFDLTVNSISTSAEQVADFTFAGTVDGSARVSGSGSLNVSDPYRYMNLNTNFEGYDLLATSPYTETFLGRELTKGLFKTRSEYEVRDSMLEGSIDLRIDELSLGGKVESERAINLPIGFAISLLRGPNGVIEPPTVKVSGNLDDPEVKFWPIVGQAFRNLILNMVASPFKFLASLAGGRDDLDTFAFEMGQVSLDEEGKEKIEALRTLLTNRPGLKVEVAYKGDPAEKAYLLDQYRRHLLANPDFEVASGIDLLAEVDPVALETNVRELYAALQASAPEEPVGEGVGSSTPPAATASKTQGDGVVQRLASLLGLGKGKAEQSPSSPANAEANAAGTAETEDADGPSFEEIYAFVTANWDGGDFNDNWIKDLASARVQAFKAALLEGGAVAGDRVFSSGSGANDAQGPAGALLLKLAD